MPDQDQTQLATRGFAVTRPEDRAGIQAPAGEPALTQYVGLAVVSAFVFWLVT